MDITPTIIIGGDRTDFGRAVSSAGDIIWFDPMVAPVNPVTDQDREALKILFEWDEDRQKQYQEAVRDKSYFDYEHKAGLFYAEDNTAITSVRYQDIDNPEWLTAVPRQMLLPQNTELGVLDDYGNTVTKRFSFDQWCPRLWRSVGPSRHASPGRPSSADDRDGCRRLAC